MSIERTEHTGIFDRFFKRNRPLQEAGQRHKLKKELVGIAILALMPLFLSSDHDQQEYPLFDITIQGEKIKPQFLALFRDNRVLEDACCEQNKPIMVEEASYPLDPQMPSFAATMEEKDGKIFIRILDSQGVATVYNLDNKESLPVNWRAMEKGELIAAIQQINGLHELWHTCARGTMDVSQDDLDKMNIHFEMAFCQAPQEPDIRKISNVQSLGFAFQVTAEIKKGKEERYCFKLLEEVMTDWFVRHQTAKNPRFQKVIANVNPYSKSHDAFLEYLSFGDKKFFHEVVSLKKRGDVVGFRNLLAEKIAKKIGDEQPKQKDRFQQEENQKRAMEIANKFIKSTQDPISIFEMLTGVLDFGFRRVLSASGFEIKEVDDYTLTITPPN